MHILEGKKNQIRDLNFQIKKLEKEEKIKAKANKKKEIIKIKTEISKIENR